MAFSGGTGGNPRFGRDSSGPLPPGVGFNTTAGLGATQQTTSPYAFAYQAQHSRQPLAGAWYSPLSQNLPQLNATAFGCPVPTVGNTPLATIPIQAPVTYHQPSTAQGQGPQPLLDRNFRTCSMRNSTGGFGCEPGYNYFFPAEHTKIHVLKTGSTPPWQLPSNFAIQFHATHVPVNTTVAELMKGFGARNSVPKKNVITEVCPGGGGKWYKGIELRGDDVQTMKLPIKELGWDASRTGLRGEKKVVYVYVQKG